MIGLADVRDWMRSLTGRTDAVWTIGRYEKEKEKRICVYQRPDYGCAQVALGGSEATVTIVKRIQVLVHWNKNHRETEEAAQGIYDALRFNPRAEIAGCEVSYVGLALPEPVDLGSDESGIFERTIWVDLHYRED